MLLLHVADGVRVHVVVVVFVVAVADGSVARRGRASAVWTRPAKCTEEFLIIKLTLSAFYV